VAPIELPIKTVPSASARMAGGNVPCRDKSTGFSGWLRSPGACSPLASECQWLLSDRLLLWVRSGDAVARKAPDYTHRHFSPRRRASHTPAAKASDFQAGTMTWTEKVHSRRGEKPRNFGHPLDASCTGLLTLHASSAPRRLDPALAPGTARMQADRCRRRHVQ